MTRQYLIDLCLVQRGEQMGRQSANAVNRPALGDDIALILLPDTGVDCHLRLLQEGFGAGDYRTVGQLRGGAPYAAVASLWLRGPLPPPTHRQLPLRSAFAVESNAIALA
jgi:hypothetical protein